MRDLRISSLRWIVVWLGGLAIGSAVLNVSAQGPPVGSWDFVLSGRYQHGVAQITFAADGTLGGIGAFTFFGRNVAHTNHGFVITNLYGAADLDGAWVYDGPNHITGFINQLSYSVAGSQTNVSTNGLSFRAVVKPSRLSMLVFGPQGRVNYKGIPLEATNDLSGIYHGNVHKRAVPFPSVEVFTADIRHPFTETSYYTETNCSTVTTCVTNTTCVTITNCVTVTNSITVTNYYLGTNFYSVLGRGPGYDYSGLLLVSRQRYAAFYQDRGQSGSERQISTYAGPCNINNRRGSLIGTDGTNTTVRYRMLPEMP